MSTGAKALIFLGCYLLLAGIAGFASNPAGAKTALVSGGTFGTLCIICGTLLARGITVARWAGLGVMALLTIAFVWRATVGWIAVANGQGEKLFPAVLISSMLVATLLALRFVLKR